MAVMPSYALVSVYECMRGYMRGMAYRPRRPSRMVERCGNKE